MTTTSLTTPITTLRRLLSRAPLVPLLAVGLALGLTVTAALPADASPVDGYADYEPQTTCVSQPLPGTQFLASWLLREYPGTGPTSMLRPCSAGSGSEHKDGRAVDWMMDATNPADRALVDRFFSRIFATDRNGNPHALARRMGIMYVIWNDHIYASYSGFSKRDYLSGGCVSRRKCSTTLRHRDHVHISLSRSGAAAQTTFYRNRDVASVPVLVPGTRQLDPEDTAVVRIDVPADGSAVRTGFRLTGGTAYRIVADGLYRNGPGSRVGDAACRWARRAGRWVAYDGGLRVNGRNVWRATTCEDGDHAYITTVRTHRNRPLRLQLGDETTGNNAGSVRFYVLREDIPVRAVARHYPSARRAPLPVRHAGERARRLVRETVEVRAHARRGVPTSRSLRPGARYRVAVRGTARSGSTVFDGNCVRYAGRFRRQHSLNLARPAADHLSLFVQGVRVRLHVPGSSRACDGRDHRYVGTFRAVEPGTARLRVWDPFTYRDNRGSLRVTLRRL